MYSPNALRSNCGLLEFDHGACRIIWSTSPGAKMFLPSDNSILYGAQLLSGHEGSRYQSSLTLPLAQPLTGSGPTLQMTFWPTSNRNCGLCISCSCSFSSSSMSESSYGGHSASSPRDQAIRTCFVGKESMSASFVIFLASRGTPMSPLPPLANSMATAVSIGEQFGSLHETSCTEITTPLLMSAGSASVTQISTRAYPSRRTCLASRRLFCSASLFGMNMATVTEIGLFAASPLQLYVPKRSLPSLCCVAFGLWFV
mmetsp:Transcript_18486/g.43186  ORF Transcript_18486/g.43186 Transcript_18486/m.43186 type:complete len:257 (+) Transcript_18486:148-918(+)